MDISVRCVLTLIKNGGRGTVGAGATQASRHLRVRHRRVCDQPPALCCGERGTDSERRPLAGGRKHAVTSTTAREALSADAECSSLLAASAPALLRWMRLAASLCANPWLLGSGSCCTLCTRLCTGAGCCVRPSQDRASNPGGLMYGWPGFSTSQRRCNCLPQ